MFQYMSFRNNKTSGRYDTVGPHISVRIVHDSFREDFCYLENQHSKKITVTDVKVTFLAIGESSLI